MSENTEVKNLGLRQRKNTPDHVAKKANTTPGELAEKYCQAFANKFPASVRPYIFAIAPILGKLVFLIDASIPYIIKTYEYLKEFWDSLAPYRPDLLIPSFAGLIMCFFGGSFLTVIAAVEAYRMCGYETTLQCIKDLITDFTVFAEANKNDDQKDDDGDGVSDVLQISSQELLSRKMFLFLRTVDPQRITNALAGLNSGFCAVVATLKIQFVKAITLGNAISSTLERPAKMVFQTPLELLFGNDYKRWAGPLIEYTVKSIAISIAWFIQRIISAFHSAIRGGIMFSRNILEYTSEMKILELNHEDTFLDEIVGYGVAFLGFWFQISYGFRLPFPLNILLLPISMLEWFLMWVVNTK